MARRCVVWVLVDERGAQVLPPVGDERASVPAYFAHLACDADVRLVSEFWAELAGSLEVRHVGA